MTNGGHLLSKFEIMNDVKEIRMVAYRDDGDFSHWKLGDTT